MLVLAGLPAAAVAEPRLDEADSVLADGEEGASAARSSAGRIELAYLTIVAALQLALGVGGPVLKGPEDPLGSRKTLSAKLAVSRPITALALLVSVVHAARRNGFGSTA
jgi:hypothetical protein